MNLLIIGMKGRVLAIDRATGEIAWETHLKSSGFVSVYLEPDRVAASTRGELWCLDSHSGKILWHNKLKGMGYGLVSFGYDPANQIVLAAQIHAQQQAAAASGAAAAGAAG